MNGFHNGITPEKLAKAVARNPDGVARLAKFVGAADTSPEAVAEACWHDRLAGFACMADRAAIHATRFLVEK
jgi:hypothetical protein